MGSKFVQIAATTPSALYALDDSGNVWRFDPADDRWILMPSARVLNSN